MTAWTATFDQETVQVVRELVTAEDAARERPWHALLVRIAPHLEAWGQGSFLLRRCGLATEDDARMVLVAVLERLKRADLANLRRFLAGAPDHVPGDVAAVERLAALAVLARDEQPDDAARQDEDRHTPLRGWLLTLVRYAAADHVRRRFGWSVTAEVMLETDRPLDALLGVLPGVVAVSKPDAGVVTVEYLPGTIRAEAIARAAAAAIVAAAPHRRDAASGAEPLTSDVGDPIVPRMTDALTLAKLVAEVTETMADFPPPMRGAVELWLADTSFDEITRRLALGTPAQARALVRAGQARLRERFRDRWEQFLSTPVRR